MSQLKELLQLDLSYYETFSNRSDKSWGSLFYKENQPNYYDSNHAHILDECIHPISVIDEVISFYQSKQITPRFYIYNIEKQQRLITELKSRNFGYEELINPVQLWNNAVTDIKSTENVSIEEVTKKNYQEALDIECSITEFGGRESIEKVFKKQFHHPSFTHYLLRLDGIACSTACMFEENENARMESVATLEAYRGRGLIGEMIRFIQKEVIHRKIEKLWVFPINESIERVYQKYNFQTITKFRSGHAFLSGKSIQEIRE
ncbi:GNAT family acetyltransferase [Fictibacillus phosphorivorans]|uniref:GNAT family acetyltransferase n=1 Tax=Fictibacillus phosphorivorans TaxID=1221500 RepID=A0A160IN87_9BACL|nr:GNAT family N-acetyltransferase [Fictibacillus phosphorivorans]ANC77456.1 GNAT family acetyltransferase [Fictibacillus phosphorivorans]